MCVTKHACFFPPNAYLWLRPLDFHLTPQPRGAECLSCVSVPESPLPSPATPLAAHFMVKGPLFRIEPACMAEKY